MSFRRLSRLAAPVSAGAVLLARAAAPPPELAECSYDVRRQGVSSGMHIELQKLRPREEQLRRKWEEDEAGFHKLPPRAWPPVQPKPEELPALQEAAAAADAPPQAQFDLATCLTFNNLDPVDGLRRYRELAKSGAGQNGQLANHASFLRDLLVMAESEARHTLRRHPHSHTHAHTAGSGRGCGGHREG